MMEILMLLFSLPVGHSNFTMSSMINETNTTYIDTALSLYDRHWNGWFIYFSDKCDEAVKQQIGHDCWGWTWFQRDIHIRRDAPDKKEVCRHEACHGYNYFLPIPKQEELCSSDFNLQYQKICDELL